MKWMMCCVMAMMGTLLSRAQSPQFAYRIIFKDKAGSPQTSSAATFLSARALARRSAQGLSPDSTDRPVSHLYLDTVIMLSQGKLHNTSRWMNSCVILLTDSSKMQFVRAKSFVQNTAWVGYFVNGLHRPDVVPGAASSLEKGAGNPSYYNNSWAQTTMVNGDYLHDNGYRGEGKLIAVLDLGFLDVDHHAGFDSLRSSGRILDTWNFIVDSANVYRYVSHGTEALSTMAGYMPNSYVGTAPKAQYALYITDDYTVSDIQYETDNLIAGMERADSLGADIISTSTGYNEFLSPYYFIYPKSALDGKTIDVSRAANMATSKGMLVVAAAGNEGGNSWNFLLAPGDADSVLTVGAVDAAKAVAGFSSPGPNSANKVKPDVCASGSPAIVLNGFNNITSASGTSFSTPQIAGWAACLWQARANARPYNLRKAINESADHFTNPGVQIGYGVPDFKKAFLALGVSDVPGATVNVAAYPNPANTGVTILLPLQKATMVQYAFIDAAGKTALQAQQMMASGLILINLPKALPAGVYHGFDDRRQYLLPLTNHKGISYSVSFSSTAT